MNRYIKNIGISGGVFVLFVLFSFFTSLLSFAGFYSVKAYDSIAGYGTEIKIANAKPFEKVKIFILPPSGELQTYLQSAKKDGTLSFLLSSEKTKRAGIYKVVVVEPSQNYSDGVVHDFEIFADDPDVDHSFFYAIDQTIPTGSKGKLSLLLRDKYDNPVQGHRIALSSSRKYEKFTTIGEAKTNDAGEASFIVQSAYSGDALISVTDETYGEKVAKSITVRFYQNALSGNLLGDSTNGDNSLVSKFSIDFPDTVPMNSDANYLTITALDSVGNIVKNFTGSIIIKVPTDANATIPAENGIYSFTEADQGKIVFSRSLVFSKAGRQRIEVYSYNKTTDETNVNIFAKKDVTVENKTPGIEEPNTTPIKIITPSNNTVLAAKSVIVTGTALKNTDLQVLIDKDIVKSIETDENGEFSTTLVDLPPGEHTLQIQQKNNTKILSEAISFRVGEGVGSILSASITPVITGPKEIIEVQTQIDTTITPKSVDVSVNGIAYPLTKVKEGMYQGSFPAPSEVGEYEVTLAVQNTLGEIKEKIINPKLKVQNSPSVSSLTEVTGLVAEYNPERKIVTLSWNKITLEPLLFIIHSGDKSTTLQKVKSVGGSLNSTEIEISNFSEKYFAIAAVDSNGKEGVLSKSVLMKLLATPTPMPTATTTPTPATPMPTVISTPKPSIRLIPQENSIKIEWDAFSGADGYVLLYGTSSGVYQESIRLSKNENKVTLSDLISGMKYFISLEAKDSSGKTLYEYSEISNSPLQSAFHASAHGGPQPYPMWTTQTGPQFSLTLGGLFLVFSAFFLGRKRRR